MKKPGKPPRSLRPTQNGLLELTPEEVAAACARDVRRRQPRYPLNVVADLAQRFVVHDVPDTSERAPYIAAARRAIMLLDACQEELLRDAAEHARKENYAGQNALILEHRQIREKLCADEVASFKKGLLHITGQKSETLALPLFKRWRRGLREHPDVFAHVARDPGPDTETAIRREIEQYRAGGFDLNTLEQFEICFRTWYEEFEKPSVRAQVGRKGGAKSRRKRH